MTRVRNAILGSVLVVGAAGCGLGNASGEVASQPTRGLVEEHAAALTSALGKVAPASYSFPLPDGWVAEQDPLPPPWDPTFPFTGQEQLRFLPGFPDGTSPQNFSYDYLLWIDSGPTITAPVVSAALLEYYKGLICGDPSYPCDASGFQIRMSSLLKTKLLEIMTGSIDMLDAAHLPIRLNFFVSSVTCPRSHHRALLVSASPQPYDSPVYADLLEEQLRFRCQ
ncbi:MAG TPA: hypothetical protein VIU64_11775 [Polyangia bacterium]